MTVSLSLFRFLRRDYSCAVASTEILLLSDVRRGCRYKIFFARENPLSRLRGEEPRKHRSPLCATARGKRVAAAETARVHRTLQRTGSARRGRHSPILDSYCECFIPRLYPRGHRRVAFCQRIIRAGFSFLRQMSNRTWRPYRYSTPRQNYLAGRVGRRGTLLKCRRIFFATIFPADVYYARNCTHDNKILPLRSKKDPLNRSTFNAFVIIMESNLFVASNKCGRLFKKREHLFRTYLFQFRHVYSWNYNHSFTVKCLQALNWTIT